MRIRFRHLYYTYPAGYLNTYITLGAYTWGL